VKDVKTIEGLLEEDEQGVENGEDVASLAQMMGPC
jgi:hypothetical protein